MALAVQEGKKVFISRPISGVDNYKVEFNVVEERLINRGHTVLKPSVLPLGFEHHEYIDICKSMIDACECAYFMHGWQNSVGCRLKHGYAEQQGKKLYYEEG